MPVIRDMPQLQSIYILCTDKSIHEEWTLNMPKVKGVHTEIELIYRALQADCKSCDRGMIPITYSDIDALFMYAQLLKEVLLEIGGDEDESSLKGLVDYCRFKGDVSEDAIKKLENEYHSHTPIWWYTGPFFMFSTLNRGLRLMDTEIIMKMGFFIRHLHNYIDKAYQRQQASNEIIAPFQVYRGQSLSCENFETTRKIEGGLMSFNNFLSTSLDREISLEVYARASAIRMMLEFSL